MEHREAYDHLGEITGWVADLDAAWTDEQARTRVFVEPKAAMVSIDYTLPAPPAIAWDYLTSPARRLRWQAGVTDIVEEAAAGRRGVGTTNHCVHGKDAVVEEILDWRPSEYFTLNWQMPIPGSPKVKTTYELTGVDAGHRGRDADGASAVGQGSRLPEQMLPGLKPIFEAGHRRAHAARAPRRWPGATPSATMPRAGAPASAGRFLEACRFGGGPFVVRLKAAARRPLERRPRHAVRAADLHAGADRGRPGGGDGRRDGRVQRVHRSTSATAAR